MHFNASLTLLSPNIQLSQNKIYFLHSFRFDRFWQGKDRMDRMEGFRELMRSKYNFFYENETYNVLAESFDLNI